MKQITCTKCEKPNCSASHEESEICVRCALDGAVEPNKDQNTPPTPPPNNDGQTNAEPNKDQNTPPTAKSKLKNLWPLAR